MHSKEAGKRPRVGIISIHPAPYRDATFAALHRRGVIDATIVTLFDSDRRHTFWDLETAAYRNIDLGKHYRLYGDSCFHPRILSVLRRERFDVILLPGYYYVTLWVVLIYCLLTRTPFIFSTDKIGDRPSSRIRKLLASRIAPWVLRTASGFWIPGKATRQYLHKQAIEDKRLFEGSYNLDYFAIRDQVERCRETRSNIRQDFSIDENAFLFLMMANVEPKRRHDLLLESFSRVLLECPDAHLLVVGKGTDRDTMARLTRGKEIKNVILSGPVPFGDLPALYAASDAYIHSGAEAYSTSVAYAAIAGLPIIASSEVGATHDYVVDGETGYAVGAKDVCGFAEKMKMLTQDRELAKSQGCRVAELSSRFTSDWAAEQFENAVALALE
ncbi:MAG: glycosyltransferase family 4 protein [Anaerolineae bacterium]|nr:glycosyltransferase family 4 protein [Anaerolineae bacterium]